MTNYITTATHERVLVERTDQHRGLKPSLDGLDAVRPAWTEVDWLTRGWLATGSVDAYFMAEDDDAAAAVEGEED